MHALREWNGIRAPALAAGLATTPSPDVRNNQSSATAVVRSPSTDVSIVEEGPASAPAGGTIEYSITVTNHGPLTATDVIVRDPIDQSLVTVTALPSHCALRGGTSTCRAGTLVVGQTKTFRFTVTVGGDVQPGTHIVNCAAAASATTLLSLTAVHSCTGRGGFAATRASNRLGQLRPVRRFANGGRVG